MILRKREELFICDYTPLPLHFFGVGLNVACSPGSLHQTFKGAGVDVVPFVAEDILDLAKPWVHGDKVILISQTLGRPYLLCDKLIACWYFLDINLIGSLGALL